MFDIHIRSTEFQRLTKAKSSNEFIYEGEIPKSQSQGASAFWEGPRWIGIEEECDKYIEKYHEAIKSIK